jgi:hypothetical protein
MFPVCGEDRGTTTTPVVVLVVDPVDSPSSNFEKFLRNFQNCEDGSTRSTPRKKVEEYLVVFSGSEDTLVSAAGTSCWCSIGGWGHPNSDVESLELLELIDQKMGVCTAVVGSMRVSWPADDSPLAPAKSTI